MGSDKKCKSLDSARGKFNYLFKDSIFKTLSNSLLQLFEKKGKIGKLFIYQINIQEPPEITY